MLILTRRLGEGIRIGNDVRIVILEVKGNQVRLGIQAPQGVPVYREEVLARIMNENRKAANLDTDNLNKILKKNIPYNSSTEEIKESSHECCDK